MQSLPNPQNDSSLKPIKYAVVILMGMLNVAYFLNIQNTRSHTELRSINSSTTVVWVIVLGLIYLLAHGAKSRADSVRHNQSITAATGMYLVVMAIFELGGLLGFASVFTFNSSLYLVSGTLFSAITILLFVPDK